MCHFYIKRNILILTNIHPFMIFLLLYHGSRVFDTQMNIGYSPEFFRCR